MAVCLMSFKLSHNVNTSPEIVYVRVDDDSRFRLGENFIVSVYF